MGAFSASLKIIADRLLTTYGETITFVRWSTDAYDTTTGEVEPVMSTTFGGMCHPSPYTENEIDGQTVQVNDVRVTVYAITEPLIEDEATLDSVVYRVMNVEKIRGQGETIVYRLQLRV